MDFSFLTNFDTIYKAVSSLLLEKPGTQCFFARLSSEIFWPRSIIIFKKFSAPSEPFGLR